MQQQELEHENKRLRQENSNLKDDMMLHSSKCGGILQIFMKKHFPQTIHLRCHQGCGREGTGCHPKGAQ
jgi:hypothetical protein